MPRGVPQRPHVQSSPSIDTFQADMQKQQSQSPSFRASRLTAEPGTRNDPGRQSPPLHSLRPPSSSASTSFSGAKNGGANDTMQVSPLAAGTLLRGGRYRLHEQRGRQDWLSGSYEAMWVAQDAQRGGSQVAICELVLPDNASIMIQSFLGSATRSLSQVGRHPHISTLWDAFSDKGRSFFVFEPVDGESLLARMRRTGRAMPEQDAIECCLQMTEILELLAQQSPPLMHGLISPEHVFSTRNGSQYVLTNFSLVLAGGATQFIAGIDRSLLTPYAAPEFTRGAIDVRSDLYSLMATAYHTVTGSVPSGVSGSIPSAQRLNPNVSAEFDAILSKGLRPIAAQRYQRPSELRHDLLAMRSVSGSLVPGGVQSSMAAARSFQNQQNQQNQQNLPTSAVDIATQEAFKPVAQALQSIVPLEDDEDKKNLLPRPEDLPPMPRTSVQFSTGVMLGIILLSMIILVAVSRGF